MGKKKSASETNPEETLENLDFEQALREVEGIVARLEGGQLGLSESLQQYEMGIKQLKRCQQLLDSAEQRVNVLAGFDAEGNPVLESLGDAAASRGGRSPASSPRRKADSPRDRDSDNGGGDDDPTSEGLF